MGQGERQFPVTVVPQTCSYYHSSHLQRPRIAMPRPAAQDDNSLAVAAAPVARLAASARTTLSSARTSHRPRSLVTSMAKRFSTPRTDRKNASRLRARSFEASHTTHSDSQNTVAAAQFSALHASEPPHLFIRKGWEDRSEGLARRHALLIPRLRSFKIFLARCTEPTPKPHDRRCDSVARIFPAGTGPSP